ncbi:MAG: hypothetical protein AAF456_08835 [Planctomycetota bacterium]
MVLLSVVMAIALAIAFLVRSVAEIDIPVWGVLAAFGVVYIGSIAALFFAEYPTGDELAMMRIGFATFCRIGLPAVALLFISSYSSRAFTVRTFAFLGAFYLVGLMAGVLLSLLRYSQTEQISSTGTGAESSEVDRATA